MAHRNLFGASPIPDSYTINPSVPSNPNPQRRFESALLENKHMTMNSCVGFPYQGAANSGSNFNKYCYPASSVGLSQTLPYQAQHVPYCYDQHANVPGVQYMPYSLSQQANGIGIGMVHPQAQDFRLPYKRKIPPSHPYENASGSQFATSSSNFQVPPNNSLLNPKPGLRQQLHPYGRVPVYCDENLLSAGEKYPRNVRSRHNDAPHLALNPVQQSSSRNPTHQFQSSAGISPPIAVGQSQHTSLPGTYAHWSHPTDDGRPNHVVNHFIARNCIPGGTTGSNSTCNSGQSVNSNATASTFHVSHAQGTWVGPSSYDCPSSYNQRQILSRTSSNCTNRPAADFVNSHPSLALSRNTWPVSLHNNCIDRGRNYQEVHRAFTDWNGHQRWSAQALSMVDVSSFTDSLDLFDEHRDLRLDIDNMSYEELLALEERIGNVNTGLSEINLSDCLTERIYTSMDSAQVDQDEASCPICLEELKDGDIQGILNCHHVFHISCIRDWLRLKNVCPVCKIPALDDYVK